MKRFVPLILLIMIITPLTAKNQWFTKDKVLHLGGSAIVTYWNYGISKDIYGSSHKKSLYFSVSFTSVLGLGKEFSDKELKQSKWSWRDIVYDAAGISLGLIMINNMR